MQITNAFVWQPELGAGNWQLEAPDRPERDVAMWEGRPGATRETAYQTPVQNKHTSKLPLRLNPSPTPCLSTPSLAPVKAQQQPQKRDVCATGYIHQNM